MAGRGRRTAVWLVGLIAGVLAVCAVVVPSWREDLGMRPIPHPAAAEPVAHDHPEPIAPGTGLACTTAKAPFVPSMLLLPSLNLQVPLLTEGRDGDAIPSPPLDMAHTGVWYSGSQKAAAPKGHVVITAHTYHLGGALGNELLASPPRSGQVFILTDRAGHRACYRATSPVRFQASTYKPSAGLLTNSTDTPQIALVVCDGYQGETHYWADRVVFRAALTR